MSNKTEELVNTTKMSSENTETDASLSTEHVENKNAEENTSNNQPNSSGEKFKKVFYKFTSMTFEEFETMVNEWTNNLSTETNSTNTVKYFQNTLSKAKEETDSGIQIFSAWTFAPKNPDITKQLIGKDGCYLHKTTENYGLYAIWHNRTENKFYVVGPKYRKPDEIQAPTKVPDGKDVNVLKGSLDFLRYRMMKLRQKK